MRPAVVLMNFTHVYEHEKFIGDLRFQWIDCTDLSGTDCYCDTESARAIVERISPYPVEGIHFIDSGNYHYVSKFWVEKIKEPFSLIVFDHHPDMQPSRFGGLTTCGSWVKELLDTNPYLKRVCIVGVADELVGTVESRYRNRVKFCSETELSRTNRWCAFFQKYLDGPVYISLDKDVLERESAITNWDQGTLPLFKLEIILSMILKRERLIGVDICGEYSAPFDICRFEKGLSINSGTNRKLLTLFISADWTTVCHENYSYEG